MLFFPSASRSLGLSLYEVCCDASNTRQQGLLTELPFQTAVQVMSQKYARNICYNIH